MGAVIAKQELFERLAQGRGITVVTPNVRLARELAREFAVRQAARGLAAWDDADILPLAAFAGRCYEDALLGEGGAGLPQLLSAVQQRELWEQAIRASRWNGALLDVPRTAADATTAWRLANAWGIAAVLGKVEGTEDTRAFAEWSAAYALRLRKGGFVDDATLPSLPLAAPRTRLLVAYAFDVVTPQDADLLGRFDAVACPAPTRAGTAARASFASPADELEAAAAWARARLEAGAKRIGVVVPELQARRREVQRIFSRVMRPGFALPGSPDVPLPFNLSAGEPLPAWPLAGFALAFLEASLREVEFEDASRLLRSPFLGGAEAELAARARLDARLRRDAPASVSLPKLVALAEPCPQLRALLERVFALKAAGGAPHQWAQHFSAVLEAAGFPGERSADSTEHQVRTKWHEALGELARLSNVVERSSGAEALARLRRICEEAEFQPESPDAPVQVLGRLESAGLEFDALWVSGLTDDAWPLRVRPHPFIPIALQKKAGIPEAAAETSLQLDKRRTQGWAAAADEVIFSWPRREEDRDLVASPLISTFPQGNVETLRAPDWRAAMFASRRIEKFEDERGPQVVGKAAGGARILSDQSACPFRAFARNRLRAEALESPEAGPDARARGQLLHLLMAGIWRDARTSSALQSDLSAIIEKSAKAAVQEMGLEGRFAELEARRLERLARDWLALESRRRPFEVVAVERRAEMEIGGLAILGRIDRLDRLEDGTHALIDYKTGSRVTPRDWEDERPDDPQLPLYALTSGEEVSALAFAKLRAGDMKFSGFSAAKGVIPNVNQARDWAALVAGWKEAIEGLAREFAAGEAGVRPKRGLSTCRRCDLHSLCRVYERVSPLSADEEEAG